MPNNVNFDEFVECLDGLYSQPLVLEMKNIAQHTDSVSCYEHCLYVAFLSYILTKRAGYDFRAAVRGAMLHDLYLQNWDETDIGLFKRLVVHPKMALENARVFNLSETECDIILNHMWPVTPKMPKTPEGKIVSLADKICASAEMLSLPAPLLIAKRLERYIETEIKA